MLIIVALSCLHLLDSSTWLYHGFLKLNIVVTALFFFFSLQTCSFFHFPIHAMSKHSSHGIILSCSPSFTEHYQIESIPSLNFLLHFFCHLLPCGYCFKVSLFPANISSNFNLSSYPVFSYSNLLFICARSHWSTVDLIIPLLRYHLEGLYTHKEKSKSLIEFKQIVLDPTSIYLFRPILLLFTPCFVVKTLVTSTCPPFADTSVQAIPLFFVKVFHSFLPSELV